MNPTRTLTRSGSMIRRVSYLLPAVALAMPAVAQQLYVYPAKGQSPEKMTQDKAECQVWASQQTGYDPMRAATTQAAPAQQPQKGGALRGGARGAAAGAAIGAIAGDAGTGAAIGAASGGLMAGAKRRHQQQAEQQAQAQQAQATSQQVSAFQRAYGTCMKGRGYTVD